MNNISNQMDPPTLEQGQEAEMNIFYDDAFRRDLTINSLMYNLSTGQLIDPTGKGLSDLKNKIIRTNFDPMLKYRAQPADMLRALRFYATLPDFVFAPNVLEAMRANAHRVVPRDKGGDISARRIERELRKAIKTPEMWAKMKGACREAGLDPYIGDQIKAVEEDMKGNINYNFDEEQPKANVKAFTKMAALGVCPKCGYGFAGLKPNPAGGQMIKLEPNDPDYDPTKPCPGCEMTQVPSAEEGRQEVPKDFGEALYVDLFMHHQYLTSHLFVGPFHTQSDAENVKLELMQLEHDRRKWLDLLDYVPQNGRVVKEQEMQKIRSAEANRMNNSAAGHAPDGMDFEVSPVLSPAKARQEAKEAVSDAKQRHLEDLEYERRPKKPNTASFKKVATPEVFNSERDQVPFIIVYRVMDSEGGTPYDRGLDAWPEFQEDRAGPPPSRDLGFLPEERKSSFFEGKYIFGFLDEAQFHRWFNPEQIKRLYEEGFKLVPVKASRVFDSGNQIFFEPYDPNEIPGLQGRHIHTASKSPIGTVYLIHFEDKLHHAGHYIGFTKIDAETRFEEHLAGQGGRLLQVLNEKGIKYKLIREWNNVPKYFERQLKNQKNAWRLCPICSEEHGRQPATPSVKPKEQVKMKKRVAALGVCPKCGYGFAGLKPNPAGGQMIKLEPNDPDYDPTKPCPGCEMTQVATQGEQDKKEGPQTSERWYVYDNHGIPTDDGLEFHPVFAGPFSSKDDAEAHSDGIAQLETETERINNESDALVGVAPEDLPAYVPPPVLPGSERRILKDYHATHDHTRPIIDISSRKHTDSKKEQLQTAKDNYLKVKSRQKPKEPNVATIKSFTRVAQQLDQAFIEGPEVQIDPSLQSSIQDAVNDLKKMDPGIFKGVGKIVALTGGPFGQVSSKDPTTVHLNLNKIKQQVQHQLGSKYNPSNADHKKAFDEAVKRAIAETVAHETAHVKDFDPETGRFPGGEGVAESAERQTLQKLYRGEPIQLAASIQKEASPLLFEANEEEPYITVYRMQNAKGEGPYKTSDIFAPRTFIPSFTAHDPSKYWEMFEEESTRRQPGPRTDLGFEEHERAKSLWEGKQFGFRDLEQAQRWFTSAEIEELKKAGFALIPVKARKVWDSGKQIYFEPYEEQGHKKSASTSLIRSFTKTATPLDFIATEEEPYTTVYRVEDNQGRSPYDSHYYKDEHGNEIDSPNPTWSDMNNPGLDQETRLGIWFDRQPLPHSDQGFDIWERIPDAWQGKQFAFKDVDQYENWFSDTEIEKLSDLGFKLVPHRARKVWDSGKQVYFEPYEEHKKTAAKASSPKWIEPDLSDDSEDDEELHDRAEDLGIELDEARKAVRSGKLITPTKEWLSELQNSDLNDVQTLDDVYDVIELEHHDVDGLIKLISDGNEVDAPVVLTVNGEPFLVSGNTRLCICKALGIVPQVWVGEYESTIEHEASLSKAAVLRQRVNPHTGKKQWALVSVKDPGKILQWYKGKPSKKQVQKTEKRVTYFKNMSKKKKHKRKAFDIKSFTRLGVDFAGRPLPNDEALPTYITAPYSEAEHGSYNAENTLKEKEYQTKLMEEKERKKKKRTPVQQ